MLHGRACRARPEAAVPDHPGERLLRALLYRAALEALCGRSIGCCAAGNTWPPIQNRPFADAAQSRGGNWGSKERLQAVIQSLLRMSRCGLPWGTVTAPAIVTGSRIHSAQREATYGLSLPPCGTRLAVMRHRPMPPLFPLPRSEAVRPRRPVRRPRRRSSGRRSASGTG